MKGSNSEFMRKYPRSRTCRKCGGHFTSKGVKQHERRCNTRPTPKKENDIK